MVTETKVNRRPGRVIYRKCTVRGGTDGLVLADAVRRALATTVEDALISANWRNRLLKSELPNSEPQCAFFNHIRDANSNGLNFLFGELIGYRPGSQQALLEELDGAQELNIEALPAPEQRQFLDTMIFWMIVGDHVLLVQGPNSRRRSLEDYLQWLLTTKAAILPAAATLVLSDKLQLEDGAADSVPLRQLQIGGRVAPAPVEPGPEREKVQQVERQASRRRAGLAWARGVLNAVLGDSDQTERLLAGAKEGQELTVDVRLGFNVTKKATPVPVSDLAEAVRNIDDADIRYETKSGMVTGDMMRLHYNARIVVEGGMLDREDVLRAMVQAFEHFSQNGFIDPV